MSTSFEAPVTTSDANRVIDVILEGGPHNLPADKRVQRALGDETKIKVRFYGGYEHFERADPVGADDTEPVLFRWTGRTRIAE
jgi:Family of unknown function (DUF5988)